MVEPMLVQTVKNPEAYESDDKYGAELKYNGKGVFAWHIGPDPVSHQMIRIARGDVKTDVSNDYPEIMQELARLKCVECWLQCELTYYDKKTGREIFVSTPTPTPEFLATVNSVLEVYNILSFNHESLRSQPYVDRQYMYERLILDSESSPYAVIGGVSQFKDFQHIRPVTLVRGTEGKQRLWEEEVQKNGREGVCYYKLDAPYIEGKSDAIIKRKNKETHDCVVIGCTKGTGKTADTFGALLVAQYGENPKCKGCKENAVFCITDCKTPDLILRYVAKVGTGFTDDQRKEIVEKLRQHSVFQGSLVKDGKQSGRSPYCDVKGVPTSKILLWCAPQFMVVEVEADRRTEGGSLDKPRCKGVRTDKPAEECVFD